MHFVGPGLSPLGWLGFAIFVVSIFTLLVWNRLLYKKLWQQGVQLSFIWRGSVLFIYPFVRPRGKFLASDRLAIASYLVLIILLVTIRLLGDQMWPSRSH